LSHYGSLTQSDELVNVSSLNEFLYCPRRFYYQRFQDELSPTQELVEGAKAHRHGSGRGGWISEQYLSDESLGLHGKIDVIESDGGRVTPIERKRSESGAYHFNDEIQLAGYAMLLETSIGSPVNVGYIYTRSTDVRHTVRITDSHREAVEEIANKIRNLSVDSVPPIVDNPKKCGACSARKYCMPAETLSLGHEDSPSSAWHDSDALETYGIEDWL
jgi:CRISPR-associated exonuclease Cas4